MDEQQPVYVPPPATGLSDSAASAVAYLTFLPALIFLLVAPYNTNPVVKFHAFQELGLTVVSMVLGFLLVIPVLGWLVWMLGSLVLLVMWVMCIIKASQGSAFKLPFIGKFAAEQSGYRI